MVTPQAIGFGCLQLGLGNLTTQHRLELTDNQSKEPLCLITLYLTTKVPAALILAHRAITKHPIGHALLARLAKDARVHGAGENVVEAVERSIFFVAELTRDLHRPAKGEVAGLFATDEGRLTTVKLVVRHRKALTTRQLPTLEHALDLRLTPRHFASNNKAKVVAGMGTPVVLLNIAQLHMGNGAHALMEGIDVISQ